MPSTRESIQFLILNSSVLILRPKGKSNGVEEEDREMEEREVKEKRGDKYRESITEADSQNKAEEWQRR